MELLRRDDSAQRVAARQNDPAMIHFRWLSAGTGFRQTLPLNQCATAGRAPVRLCLFGEDRVTLAADPFHRYEITGLAPRSDIGVHPSFDCPVHLKNAPTAAAHRNRRGWHATANRFPNDQRPQCKGAPGGAGGGHYCRRRHGPPAGLHRAVAGGSRLASGYASDRVQWCSALDAGRRCDRTLPYAVAGGARPLRRSSAVWSGGLHF